VFIDRLSWGAGFPKSLWELDMPVAVPLPIRQKIFSRLAAAMRCR
jgi:hypothetical protein